MSSRPKTGIFLETAVYRRKRLVDAIRMLPFFGMVLFIMPAVFIVGSAPTAPRWIFLFLTWLGMIVIAALISRALRKSEAEIEAQE